MTYLIYLTRKNVSKEEWRSFINKIASYNGILTKWQIIITNDKNQIKYYVKTKCTFPASMGNHGAFLLQNVSSLSLVKTKYIRYMMPKIDSNVLDLINYSEIKNKGTLLYIQIDFFKVYDGFIKTKLAIYLKKNDVIKKYKCLYGIPENILSVNFSENKAFFNGGITKYLEIGKMIPLLKDNSSNALLKVFTFPYLQGDHYFGLENYDFARHSVVVGASGCGKSKFISSFISNIIKNESLKEKYKVVVIDPHAALEQDIGGFGKVIDFKLVSISLFNNDASNVSLTTELLLELFSSLINQYNAKLERVLRYSIYLLLSDESFNFENLRHVLLDLEYRNDMLKHLKYTLPNSVINFFGTDFSDLKTKYYNEAVAPLINFIDEMELIESFNMDGKETLKDTINKNTLTLFSLDMTKLGSKQTHTIAGLIMQQLFLLMQRREIKEHIIFIVDEAAIMQNKILQRYLAEARKYNLSVILISQYLKQMTIDLQNAIFANVINYYIFRVARLDANMLVDNFNIKINPDNSLEEKIKLLMELNDRECIVKTMKDGKTLPVFKGKTLDYKSNPRIIKENNEKEIKKENVINEISFSLNSNINLRDILMLNSTGRDDDNE